VVCSVVLYRFFKYRLAPTPAQEAKLLEFAGVTRLVYNLALEQRSTFWRQYAAQTGGKLNAFTQGREVTELRREFDFIREAPAGSLTYALRDLDKAFANFFSGRAGYPKYRSRGEHDAFRLQMQYVPTRRVNKRWSEVRVPNLGWVRFRCTRSMEGRATSVTLKRSDLGWHACFACEIERQIPINDNEAVGIDRGIAAALTLSTGEVITLPAMARLERKTRRGSRSLSRCKRGSAGYAKKRLRLARLKARMARIRWDWQHRTSTGIARRFGTVTIEDLQIKRMTARGNGKRGLNRSILRQGWGGWADKLAYKLEERGGILLKVNPAYTSQTCSDCGAIDSESRKSQASFVCTSCGFALNADHNAAINILRRSTSVMPAEGSGCAPIEPGTCQVAA
jgi:putative transposase